MNSFAPIGAGAVALTALIALLWPNVGVPLFGLSVVVGVVGLVRFDVATRTIKLTGLPRFSAACILTGYVWLVVAASVWMLAGPQWEGAGYDLTTHAVFLGFAMSMIMGHAPTIMPAVIGRPIRYRPWMWIAFVLLQGSLLLRIVFGDLREIGWTWQLGGALNIAAVLVFMGATVVAGAQR